MHFETVNQGIRNFCVQCGFIIKQGFWYLCDHCKYEVGTKQGLICHVKTVHEGVQYYCDQCDFKATRNIA